MISYLKGKIVISKIGLVIIETGGVGYKVAVRPDLILKNSETTEFFIHEHLREDADDLFGFATIDELELFERLISVNGVGPKAGMNIMSAAKPEKIVEAIIADNVSFFTALPGIGKKVAAKIILELKSKISSDKSVGFISNIAGADEVLEALESLGYKKAELQKVLTAIPKEITSVEEKIRWCLKNLAK